MEPLLKVNDLQVSFRSDIGSKQVLDGVEFSVYPGEIVCVVGESGSGKSVTALSIMGLLPQNASITSGEILFDGADLLNMSEKERNQIRGNTLTMIFQDAMTSLNPVFTIGSQLIEAIRIHSSVTRKEAQERAIYMLERVGMPDAKAVMKKYPHTLSGGMRQRVMVAMALSGQPKLLIADEPTTALDVTIQAQIVHLLRDLRQEMGLAVLLITHDMGLVAEMADRVLVMYAGQLVEQSDAFNLFCKPLHPYTQALLQSVPSIHDSQVRRLASISGRVPDRYEEISGCRFYDRCSFAQPPCRKPQKLFKAQNNRLVRCGRAIQPDFKAWMHPDCKGKGEARHA